MVGKKKPGMSLHEQIADLEDPTPREFDPENEELRGQNSEDSHSDENAGREHYQVVGKGKLRKPDTIKLGKQYAGSRISRRALEAGESDDAPFTRHSSEQAHSEDGDSEDSGQDADQDEAEVDSAEESEDENRAGRLNRSQQSGSGLSRRMEYDKHVVQTEIEEFGSVEGSGAVPEASDEHYDVDEEESGIAPSDSEADAASNINGTSASEERQELRRLMALDQRTVTTAISQAAKADVAKGMTVKQHRSTFDALLNARIKLQKGLVALNDLPAAVSSASDVDEDGIKSAESAALALWSTLEELRQALADAQSKDFSRKRKRTPVSSITSSASLWERMTDLESESILRRRAVLDKWSLKVRGSSTFHPNARGTLLANARGKQTITAVIDAHVASEAEELNSKRLRPTSVADGNNYTSSGSSEVLYDDTAFYQSLLRDLVEQRMSSSDAITNGIESLQLQLPPNSTMGLRKDKINKEVDTKASKGRKMRYNVHEKLQNFMAPEDRGTWSMKARDEFFASLLGKTASELLGEENDNEAGNGAGSDSSGDDREEGGLRLFRSQ